MQSNTKYFKKTLFIIFLETLSQRKTSLIIIRSTWLFVKSSTNEGRE